MIHVQFGPQRLPRAQFWPNSGTCASQHFLFFDNRWKIKGRKTRFARRPPLSRLRRRFAPLRGTQRRCAALRAAPPGRYAPSALRAQAFWEHEKNADLTPPHAGAHHTPPPARHRLTSGSSGRARLAMIASQVGFRLGLASPKRKGTRRRHCLYPYVHRGASRARWRPGVAA